MHTLKDDQKQTIIRILVEGNSAVYRLLKEAGEPCGSGGAARDVLQLLPNPSDVAGNVGDGGGRG